MKSRAGPKEKERQRAANPNVNETNKEKTDPRRQRSRRESLKKTRTRSPRPIFSENVEYLSVNLSAVKLKIACSSVSYVGGLCEGEGLFGGVRRMLSH